MTGHPGRRFSYRRAIQVAAQLDKLRSVELASAHRGALSHLKPWVYVRPRFPIAGRRTVRLEGEVHLEKLLVLLGAMVTPAQALEESRELVKGAIDEAFGVRHTPPTTRSRTSSALGLPGSPAERPSRGGL